jgi:hypothetical protein
MKAWLGLRDGVHYRREAFAAGLESLGYSVVQGVTEHPGPKDVLVIWNRYRENARAADHFEQRGLPVLVAENGYLGNEFAGDRWYALSRNQHNGAGSWNVGGPQRWDGLGITLGNWRAQGGEIVVLPQRGIGPPGVAMPSDWLRRIGMRLNAAGVKHRVRPHPGINGSVPLEEDLAKASAVVTWGSGSALKALAFGIPVYHDMPGWIGSEASTPVRLLEKGAEPQRDNAARLGMFRKLIWAQARLSEITNGEALRRLLP